jgi:hypothetical protein
MSNILAMPLVRLAIETGNNENWIDCVKFVVDDGISAIENMPQLDIRGITFDMEIRREAGDNEVILAASTASDTIKIGVPPDFGFLIISIPLEDMQHQRAGAYVGDIVGHDDFYTRTVATITLTIVEGITRQPVNKRIVVESPL